MMLMIVLITIMCSLVVALVVASKKDYELARGIFVIAFATASAVFILSEVTIAVNNSTESVIKQIRDDSARREEILAIYEKAQESHDKHRQTSARAFVDVWNDEVRRKKELKDDMWIGVFVPDVVADAMEYIEVDE